MKPPSEWPRRVFLECACPTNSTINLVRKQCLFCKGWYTSAKPNQKFCQLRCRYAYHDGRRDRPHISRI